MKYVFISFILFWCFACKTDQNTKQELSDVDVINNTTITEELVDSLKKNRIDKLTELRQNVGYHCGSGIADAFLYFKIKINSNGEYSDVEVTEKKGLNHLEVQACIQKYLSENTLDLGIIREMPESKYGAIPRIKSYTLRVY